MTCRSMRTIGALAGVAALVLAFAPIGCKGRGANGGAGAPGQGQEAGRAVPVEAEAAVRETVERVIEVTGTVQAEDDVVVGSVVTAKVSWIAGEEGTFVSAGQVVVRLDDSDIQANLAQARAQVSVAEARLAQAKQMVGLTGTQTDSGVEQATQAVETAQARLEQAALGQELTEKQVAERITQATAEVELAKIGVTQAELALTQTGETTAAGVAQAEAQVLAGEARLADIKRGARSQERRQAEEAVTQAKLAMDNGKTELDRMKRLKAEGAVAQSTVDAVQLNHDLAVSQHEAALQRLSLTEEGPTPEQIEAVAQEVAAARAARDTANANTRLRAQRQEDVRRAQQFLLEAESALRTAEAGRLQIDTAERDVSAAEAGLLTAKSSLRVSEASRVQVGITEEDVLAAQAGVESAKAAIRIYEAQSAKHAISSPVSGVIADLLMNPGEVASFGQPVMRIVTSKLLRFEASVSELDVGELTMGQPVRVTVDGVAGEEFEGAMLSLHPTGDVQSRNFIVEISLPADDRVKPGMFARGLIPVEVAEDAVAISKDALIPRDGGYYAFVVVDGKAEERDLTVGLQARNRAAITEGIEEGELVVTGGYAALSDGAAVNVIEAPEAEGAPGAEEATEGDDGDEAEAVEAEPSAPADDEQEDDQ